MRVEPEREREREETSRAGNWFSGGRSTPRACHDESGRRCFETKLNTLRGATACFIMLARSLPTTREGKGASLIARQQEETPTGTEQHLDEAIITYQSMKFSNVRETFLPADNLNVLSLKIAAFLFLLCLLNSPLFFVAKSCASRGCCRDSMLIVICLINVLTIKQ